MLVPALLGGLFVGVLSALPFVSVANCCCLWIFTGGFLSVYVLQQDEREPVGAAKGAFVGLGAGAIGAFVWLIVSVAIDPIVQPFQQRLVESMAGNARDLPPEVQEIFESLSQPSAAATRFAVGFLAQLFMGLVFSTLGGLVGSAVVRPSVRVTPPSPPPAS